MNEKIKISNREKQKRFRERMKAAGYRVILTWTKSPEKTPSRSGIVKRDECAVCGVITANLEFHHSNYDKPLEGVWLCKNCHIEADKKRKSLVC